MPTRLQPGRLHPLQQDLDDAILINALLWELAAFGSVTTEGAIRREADDPDSGVATMIDQVEEVDVDRPQHLLTVSGLPSRTHTCRSTNLSTPGDGAGYLLESQILAQVLPAVQRVPRAAIVMFDLRHERLGHHAFLCLRVPALLLCKAGTRTTTRWG
jgi:hypothetical protein